MEQLGVVKRGTRQTWLLALALVAGLFVAGMPVVEAAAQKVKVKGKVGIKGQVNTKIKDTNGNTVESKSVPDMGLLGAPGSSGALAVRTFAGGTGFLGTGDCDSVGPPTSRGNSQTIAPGPNKIITGIIITGPDAAVSVTAPELAPTIGPWPVVTFRTTAQNQNVFVGLGNGLTVFPSSLVFECTGNGGPDGDGNFVILGQ